MISNLKMYIAVLDEVPDHMVPVLVAHSVLGAHLQWNKPAWDYDSFDPLVFYNYWLADSFKKVVLKVTPREFDQVIKCGNVYLAHENTVLNGEKSCAVLCPRHEWPRVIKFARMWMPASSTENASLRNKVARLEKQVSDYGWRDSPGQGAY